MLALIALVTIPLTMVVAGTVMKRSQTQVHHAVAPHRQLNAQIEEAFTGHALVKVFGRQSEVQETFEVENEELYQASFGAQFLSGLIMPIAMFIGNLNYVIIAVLGGLRVASGAHEPRRCAGVHPVLAAVHPARHPDRLDGQPAPVGRRLRRAGLRTARRGRGVAR